MTAPADELDLDAILSKNFYYRVSDDGNNLVHLDRKSAKAALKKYTEDRIVAELENIMDMDSEATYELDGRTRTGLAIPRHKIKDRIAEIKAKTDYGGKDEY